MDIIYYRILGRRMLVSPVQVLSVYPAINRHYNSWPPTFARHAEIRLIDYFTPLKRRPSVCRSYAVGVAVFGSLP
jgi:hypothetical protein